MKKYIALVTAVMLLGVTAPGSWANYYNEGHFGLTEEDAYIIDSVADMVEFRDRVNNGTEPEGLYYKLGISLNLEQYTSWESIGTYSKPFTGHFDGNGCTIKVKIIGGVTDSHALFGKIMTESGYAVKKLNVSGSVSGNCPCAGIVLTLYNASVEDCSFTGTVDSESYTYNKNAHAGGIVDYMLSGTIKNCTVKNAVIKAKSDYSNSSTAYPGGIVSRMAGGTIEGCTVDENTVISGLPGRYGAVRDWWAGNISAGGIVAFLQKAEGNLNRGSVKGNTCYAQIEARTDNGVMSLGGIVGEIGETNISVSDNIYNGDISGTGVEYTTDKAYIGGIIGKISGSNVPTISNNLYSGTAYGIGYDLGGNATDEPGCVKPSAPNVTTESLKDGRVGEEYSETLSATGAAPITWKASGLPEGLSCSSCGEISGTPKSSGTFNVTVTATNNAGSTPKTLTLTIKARPVAPTITTTSIPSGKVGEAYSATLSATGTAPITWEASALPEGLSCSSAGEISGTPKASGTFTVRITAKNAVGSEAKSLTLNVSTNGGIDTPGYEIEDTKPEFKLQSLILSGQIGVNLFMSLPEIPGVDYTDGKTCYMEFEINGKQPTPPQPFDESFKYVYGNETYYGFRCYVNSVQMADTIKATFHYGANKSVSKNCSVKGYINTVLGMNIFPEETVELMKALKDYGHYVQPMLASYNHWVIGTDHAEMDCAKLLSDSDVEEARLAVGKYAISLKGRRASAGIASMSNFLRLDSETTISVTITPSSSYSGSVSAVLDGGTKNLAVEQQNGDYLIQLSGISAHKLGDTYTLTIRAQDTIELRVSALSYVNTVLNMDASADMKKAVTALYRYYTATMAYRETL